MQVGAKRIYKIVKSLRNFSRLNEAEMKEVDIHEGIDSTLMILQNRLKAPSLAKERKCRGIEVIKEYGDLPLVECYPGELNQVFMNILVNAIDALEELNVKRLKVIRVMRNAFAQAMPASVEHRERLRDHGAKALRASVQQQSAAKRNALASKELEVGSEGLQIGPLEGWFVGRSQNNQQPANQQPANLQPDNLQPANQQPDNLQPANLQPDNLQPDNLQPATPWIRIRTEVVEGDWIAIRVGDNGIGITEELTSKLFDPFFTTKPVGKGTGLGLSISYQIVVERHGGKLYCVSKPQQGTEFIIEIPRRQPINQTAT